MKVLILGNFELSFELPDGAPATESSVRAKERRILRFLKKLASDEPGVTGSVESFEFEGFTYGESHMAEANGYYYNKTDATTAKGGLAGDDPKPEP
jgi:hypothetical protein